MDTKCTNSYFETVFSDRREISSSAEYTLTEYMQGVKRIVRTSSFVRILEKVINDGYVTVAGEVVYSVLYIGDNTGLLKNISFKEPFETRFDKQLDVDSDDVFHIFVKTSPVVSTARNTGSRLITAKGKFTLVCDVLKVNESDFCMDFAEEVCGIETLKEVIDTAQLLVSKKASVDISEEIKLDSDAPEINEFICSEISVCTFSHEISDGVCKVKGKVNLKWLYESRSDEDAQYISAENEFPFESEVEVPCIDSEWTVNVNARADSVNINPLTDDYGEQRIIDFSAIVELSVTAIKNNKCTIVKDMYSTSDSIVPQKSKRRMFSLVGAYDTDAIYRDKIHMDLRGITEILSDSLELSFTQPEFSDGEAYIQAKGILNILGVRENGELESQSSGVNMKIPVNVPEEIFINKLKWFCDTHVCTYGIVLSGGELHITVNMQGKAIALKEEYIEMVDGYEKSENQCENTLSGFSLYYPQKGESIWNIAKNHRVSYKKFKAENDIHGTDFEKETPVILR